MSTSTSASLANQRSRSNSLTKSDRLTLAYRQGWTPPPRISVPDWADRYRRLAKEAGAISGNWETSTVEVARGPMMAVTEAGVHVITVMVSTQLLKTALLENIFGYFAHLDPCPMLLLQPKEAAAEQFSKERISPLVRSTPVLRALVGSGRTRSSDETLLYKAFPGGFLALAGAGSPDNLARRPIRILLSDEVDKYPITREGDPIMLAEERTASFGANWLSVRACSPTVEDESRIEKSFLASDQRRASVECPGCGHRQFPEFFKHVHWQKDPETGGHLPKTARMYCEGCGDEWSEGERLKSLRSIRWHQTKAYQCCGERHQPLEQYDAAWKLEEAGSVNQVWTLSESPRHSIYLARCPTCGNHPIDNEHAGFTASKLYSPWSKDKPSDIAAKWLACGDDEDMKLAFYNTQLGLPYRKNSGREIQIEALAARCEVWAAEVPDGVALITVGIDTQDYRLEMEVIGWGVNEESWSIDYHVIEGEFDQPDVQALLDAYLKRIWYRADGYAFPVMAACFDSGGHHTQAVYGFCKARIGRRIWAVKGESARNGKRSPVWPTKVPSRRSKATYRPVMLGVNAAKDTITTRLMKDQPGPGYMHFPVSRDINYFAQLTAERSIVKVTGGVKYRVWEPRPGRANEGLDCRVYGYAALCGLLHMGIKLNKRAEEVNALIGTPVRRPEPELEESPAPESPEPGAASGPRVIQAKPAKRKSLTSRLA